jgi:hypothetical protein
LKRPTDWAKLTWLARGHSCRVPAERNQLQKVPLLCERLSRPSFRQTFPPEILCPCSTGNNVGFHKTSAKSKCDFSKTCLALSSRHPCQSPLPPSSRSARVSLQGGVLSLQLPAVHRGSEWRAASALFAETPPLLERFLSPQVASVLPPWLLGSTALCPSPLLPTCLAFSALYEEDTASFGAQVVVVNKLTT